MSFSEYLATNYPDILSYTMEHIELTLISILLAILIGVPLGIIISYASKVSKPVLAIANVIQAIPSMAMLGFMIPLMGIGKLPSIIAVVLYSLLPIIKNTYTGITNVNDDTLEAAKGIGLTKMQVLFRVQIPLALPVIMSGVRIASVTAVGLMTIAAYIGAGGLGFLVFSGIRMVDNNQILAGAIPACILALIVDFILGLIENLVTPISLQAGAISEKKAKRKKQKISLTITSILLVILIIFSIGSRGATVATDDQREITVASKDYTEQEIIANMVADLITERTDIKVNKKIDIGSESFMLDAMRNGDVDMFIDYTGTTYTNILNHEPINDIKKVYEVDKKEMKEKYNLIVLPELSFNDTYAICVRPDTAKKYGLKNVSDFAKVANKLTSGTTYEFSNRNDGLKGVEKHYNFNMGKKVEGLDGAPRYTALMNNEVDMVDAYATDGLIKKYNLVVLEDDKHFFPPYYGIPIIREDTLKKCPEVKKLMAELAPVITTDAMADLNYKVDVLHQKPEDVAHQFLNDNKLINK